MKNFTHITNPIGLLREVARIIRNSNLRLLQFVLVLLILLGGMTVNLAQSVGIGTTSPASSALLDLSSTSKGILIPRMTEVQRQNISSPAEGLLVFQTNGADEGFHYFNGAAWHYLHSTGLVRTTEGTNTGWRLPGPKAVNHDSIGNGAVDLVNPMNEGGASGDWSFAGGRYSRAYGDYSTALGNSSAANIGAFAAGISWYSYGQYHCVASDTGAVALGTSEARGNWASALGFSYASGNFSTALGASSAYGNYSTALGYSRALADYTTTMGYWNLELSNSLLEVGNGLPGNRSNVLTVLNNGQVGIGAVPSFAASAHAKLKVANGHILVSNNYGILSENAAGNNIGAGFDTDVADNLMLYAGGGVKGIIKANGYVGIGFTEPAHPLHIAGHSGYGQVVGRNLNSGGVTASSSSYSFSVVASNGFLTNVGYAITSDRRSKNIIGRSNDEADLEKLINIEITDYRFIDTIAKGSASVKKVIAQQVNEVYPKAVNTTTAYIPDIYKLVDATMISDRTATLQLALPASYRSGVKVRLYDAKGTTITATIQEIHDTACIIDLPGHQNLSEKVFFFGQEVDDFLTVDYDAISMLNVSATQAQQRLIEEQAERIASLEAQQREFSTLKMENATMRAELDEIKAMLSKAMHDD